MNCRDFERLWNEQLDARSAASSELEQELARHALACPSCQVVNADYQVLGRALQAWGPVPTPSAGLVDRILDRRDLVEASAGPRSLRLLSALVPVAIAASVLLVVGLSGHWGAGTSRRRVLAVAPRTLRNARPIESHSLGDALAIATLATWDLAREASAPAARISRQVLDSSANRVPSAGSTIYVRLGPSADTLQSMGNRVQSGVVPFSGTARRAFGFLLRPTLGEPESTPTLSKGA